MKKQILSLVLLTVLPPALHVTAAPTNAPGSTEEADRQFLQNLEKADAAKTRAPATTPAPVVIEAAKPASQPATAQTKVIVKRPNTIVLADDYEQATQPDEIADDGSGPAEAPVTHVTVERPTRVVREHHHAERHPLHHLLRRLLSFHPEDW
ncbi:hypothetical protein CfE428DRAFT_3726 [Chthoniobacter flavus Ellin428]|uniref:Uncharacterized protein n=1 Tax=Chthoniobacter flavus Ellin428 TaxID=497964 RepID=B4D488_9BACT|nr:hypothetical protein [Chthoniobacter flavus]EDY18689.1 hypothetical protein CfE428DRAFT_3726 [Chthoniobacter flavus Ellin428]TCO89072.1 hypothetical protein EV701_115107 [Chthoniobacter flavus]